MLWPLVLAHVLLPLAVAAAACVGAARCVRLLRYAQDARLQRLAWFYALFAASLLSWTVFAGRTALAVGGDVSGLGVGLHARFAAAQRVDAFLLLHHALMLACLGVAVRAFSPRRAAGAAAAGGALAFFAPLVPVMLALEAALTLYLAARAVQNHLARRTRGALQVAAGFLLFFLGHLSFFLLYHPEGTRSPVGDALSLAGVLLLVNLLPRPSA